MSADVCSVRRARWLSLPQPARIALIQGAQTHVLLDAAVLGRELLVACPGCGVAATERCCAPGEGVMVWVEEVEHG
jgi:hypothetical protein